MKTDSYLLTDWCILAHTTRAAFDAMRGLEVRMKIWSFCPTDPAKSTKAINDKVAKVLSNPDQSINYLKYVN